MLVLLLTAIAVLNALNLSIASGPLAALADQVMVFLPKLLAGLLLGVIAWVCAIVVRALIARVMTSTLIDVRLSAASGAKATVPLSSQLAKAGFWLTLLLFTPAVLGTLQLDGLLSPVQGMITSLLSAVPNVLAAVAIGGVGYLIARLLRTVVTSLLEAAGANRVSHALGLGSTFKLSGLAGTVVYVLVLLPTMIAALDALKIEAVSAPASAMLAQMFEAVPNIIAATLIVGMTYFVARIVSGLATEFLASLGVDSLPERLGVSAKPNGLRLSVLAGKALMFFSLLFATMEAANRLGFTRLSELANSFIGFGGDLLLGGVILSVGYWLANLAHDAIARASGDGKSPLARIARIAILGLVLAMGLRAMGLAPDIVNLAFGLTLGAVAVAGALSFGLGGRDAAGRQMEHWLSGWREASQQRDAASIPVLNEPVVPSSLRAASSAGPASPSAGVNH